MQMLNRALMAIRFLLRVTMPPLAEWASEW